MYYKALFRLFCSSFMGVHVPRAVCLAYGVVVWNGIELWCADLQLAYIAGMYVMASYLQSVGTG